VIFISHTPFCEKVVGQGHICRILWFLPVAIADNEPA
jgi:hypothetical protein